MNERRSVAELMFWAGSFFAAAVLVHNFDHVRRGADGVSVDVFAIGTAAILLEVAVVVLCVRRHRYAPLLALWSGLALAVGYLVVHFTPPRGWLSDSLLRGADAMSLTAATLEVVAALALALAGLAALRRIDLGGSGPVATRSLTAAIAHPVALVMIAGNAVVIAASVAQR